MGCAGTRPQDVLLMRRHYWHQVLHYGDGEGRLFTETRLPAAKRAQRHLFDLARVLAELHNVDLWR